MKIIKENKIYVQKNDIAFLNQTNLSIPASIFMKVYGNEVTIIDDSNRYEFLKFEEKSEIEFFRNLDWIIDYNLVKDLSEEEIIALGQSIAQQRNDIVNKYNKMSNTMKKKNIRMIDECKKLEFKMYSVRDYLWFKQGYLQINLPKDVDCSQNYEKDRENGFGKVLRKLKKIF